MVLRFCSVLSEDKRKGAVAAFGEPSGLHALSESSLSRFKVSDAGIHWTFNKCSPPKGRPRDKTSRSGGSWTSPESESESEAPVRRKVHEIVKEHFLSFPLVGKFAPSLFVCRHMFYIPSLQRWRRRTGQMLCDHCS